MAELTLLQITQEFCKRTSLPQPTTVVGAQDDTTQQILGLLNEGAQDIGQRYNLKPLQTLVSFVHGNLGAYKALDLTNESLVPGYKFMIDQTFWNTTNRLPMGGPKSPAEWQMITTMNIGQTVYPWTTYGNAIYIYPVPTPVGGTTFSFFYQSRFVVFGPAAGTFTISYNEDASTPRIQSELILADIKWRYKREKGLPYAEDQRVCEEQLLNLVGREPEAMLVLDDYPQEVGQVPTILMPWPT